MNICHGCGGVIGRDCFNPIECEQITRSMAAEYQTQPNYPAQISELLEENESLKAKVTEWEEAMKQVASDYAKLEAINKQLLEEIKELKTELQRWESGERNYEQ